MTTMDYLMLDINWWSIVTVVLRWREISIAAGSVSLSNDNSNQSTDDQSISQRFVESFN